METIAAALRRNETQENECEKHYRGWSIFGWATVSNILTYKPSLQIEQYSIYSHTWQLTVNPQTYSIANVNDLLMQCKHSFIEHTNLVSFQTCMTFFGGAQKNILCKMFQGCCFFGAIQWTSFDSILGSLTFFKSFVFQKMKKFMFGSQYSVVQTAVGLW